MGLTAELPVRSDFLGNASDFGGEETKRVDLSSSLLVSDEFPQRGGKDERAEGTIELTVS